MTPAAAVSGIYLAHPDARYFAVGRIGPDQLEPTTRLVKGSPWYKSSSGCGQISRSGRAPGAPLDRRSARCARRQHRPSSSRAADQAKAEAALLRRADFGAGWRGGSRQRRARSARRTAPASTPRSPISSSPAMPTRASRSSGSGVAVSTRTSQVLGALAGGARPTSRGRSAGSPLPRVPAAASAEKSSG